MNISAQTGSEAQEWDDFPFGSLLDSTSSHLRSLCLFTVKRILSLS